MLVLAAVAATLVLGTPTGDVRVEHLQRSAAAIDGAAGHGGTVETWTFDVRSRDDAPSSVTIPLSLAPDARIVGLSLAGARRVVVHEPDAAHAWFDVLADRGRRAALLVHVATESERAGEVALRLASVKRDAPAKVTLVVERGTGARSWFERDPTQPVLDEDHALIAVAPEVVGPQPTVTIGEPSCACDEGKPPIRRYIKRWIPRVRACYMQAAQRDPTLAGSADLAFTVTTTGAVTDVMVGGTLDSRQVQECLVAEVSSWVFPGRMATSRVHYPLQFRLAR